MEYIGILLGGLAGGLYSVLGYWGKRDAGGRDFSMEECAKTALIGAAIGAVFMFAPDYSLQIAASLGSVGTYSFMRKFMGKNAVNVPEPVVKLPASEKKKR